MRETDQLLASGSFCATSCQDVGWAKIAYALCRNLRLSWAAIFAHALFLPFQKLLERLGLSQLNKVTGGLIAGRAELRLTSKLREATGDIG